jgi:hypothetical protein
MVSSGTVVLLQEGQGTTMRILGVCKLIYTHRELTD